jgi:hypothetical protein
MAQHIVRCLEWVRNFLAPHRGITRSHMPRAGRTFVVRPWGPPDLPTAGRRTPEPLIAGDATAMVRPYVVAEEQRQRRRDWLSATTGVDAAGPYWIHGEEVA